MLISASLKLVRALFLAAVAVGLFTATGAAAEGQAKLYRVDDGVFELRTGKSMDLTNRHVLLLLPPLQDERLFSQGRFAVMLAGQRLTVLVGQRLDLKRYPTSRKTFEDKDECFLDIIDFVAPKGAPATATFRLSCL